MFEVKIRDVPVKFPLTPYPLQIEYMSKVIECLQNESHGVLESPTGTGKTLSLLCATLAWLELKKTKLQARYHTIDLECLDSGPSESNAGDIIPGVRVLGQCPQIIYSSRTHSQLLQAMKELKKTAYKYMKSTVMGSRDQMCVHPEVRAETTNYMKTQLCQLKVKTKSCRFYNRVELEKGINREIVEKPILDIEDLVRLGETHKFCPYFMSKELKQDADVVFMPYNYLLDPRMRKALGIGLQNCIVILDEAHNVEKICEDSASFQFKSTDIALCMEEVTAVMGTMKNDQDDCSFNDTPADFSQLEVVNLKESFMELEKALDGLNVTEEGTTYSADYIFTLLANAQINDSNYGSFISLLDRMSTYLAAVNTGPFQRKGTGLSTFSDILSVVYSKTDAEFRKTLNKCYKVHINIEASRPGSKPSMGWMKSKKECKVVNYWCFNPGFGMNILVKEGVKTIILTSGTLSPLKPLITELQLNAKVQLENPHIVTKEQVCIKILSKGPDGVELNSSFKNRDSPQYMDSLGYTISNLARVIPGGLLIFFPSYPIMLKCKNHWEGSGLWSTLNAAKGIFMEPRDKQEFHEAMSHYYQCINDPNLAGAIFMGVVRGKVSEGLDFANNSGRAVIITGLPYPPLKDPRIILKKRYLDNCRIENNEYPSGNDWYSLEATKAVNQAIGRVIRHKNDYGAIILMDSRFNNQIIINKLSLWLRGYAQRSDFGAAIRDLSRFFKGAQVKFPITNTLELNDSESAEIENPATSSALPFTSSFNEGTNENRRRNRVADSYVVEKRRKIIVGVNKKEPPADMAKDYLKMVAKYLPADESSKLVASIKALRADQNVEKFFSVVTETLIKRSFYHMLEGLKVFLIDELVPSYEALIAKYIK